PESGAEDPRRPRGDRRASHGTRPGAPAGWAQPLDHAAPRAGSRPHQRVCIRRAAPPRARAAAGEHIQKVSRDDDRAAFVDVVTLTKSAGQEADPSSIYAGSADARGAPAAHENPPW